MKRNFKWLAASAVFVCMAPKAFAAENPFSDVPLDHWSYAAVAQLAADGYMSWMHAAPDVAPDAAAYMRIVGASLPFFVLTRTLAGVLQGSGDTVTPMKISLLSV